MSSVESTSSKRPIHVSVAGDGTESYVMESGHLPDGSPRDDEKTVISKNPPLGTSAGPANATPVELRNLLVGETLDHYELQEFIGGGGMGSVFRALDTLLDRIVALKVLARDQSKDDETLRRFRNEAQSAARLDHENIARAYGVGEDKGLHYIAFEHIEGINIRALVERKGALPIHEAVSYTLQIAEALAHAHSRDVVHRDIKPSNVLITADGRAKLVDMGLARVRRGDQPGDDLTASGVTLGTFDYISPEQARDPRNADVRSDIYSLGCTLYYMLTARPPFPEGTVLQKLLDHQGNTPADPRQFNAALPEELCRIITRMLAKDPKRRYQRPGELLSDLILLADELGWQPHVTERLTWLAPRSARDTFLRHHLPWMVPLGALVCIAVVLHFLWNSPADSFELGDRPISLTTLPAATGQNSTDAEDKPAAPSDKVAAKGGAKSGNGRSQKGSNTPKKPAGSSPSTNKAVQPDKTTSPLADVPGLEKDPPEPSATDEDAAATDDESTDTTPADKTGDSVAAVASAATGNNKTTLPPENSSGSDPDKSGSPTVAPAESPVPAVVKPAIVIIGASPGMERDFPTLRAACQSAKSGDVIELRFNGRREEPKPIRLDNLRVTVRAADQFKPVITFRPNEVDPLKYARSMLLVSGGQLTLINVALELEVPRQIPANRWALMELQRAELVRLERCSLTIRNASSNRQAIHSDVSFVDVTAPAGDGMMMDDDAQVPMPPAIVGLQMQNCVVRGEASLLRSRDQQPISLQWDNGLLATTEALYYSQARPMPARQPGLVRIELRHITAYALGGLCRTAASDSARFLLPIEFDCSNSIIMVDPNASLIQQIGVDTSLDYRRLFTWHGNRNLYDQFTVFWKTVPLNAQEPSADWTAARWQAFWTDSRESAPSWGPVVWKQTPAANRPLNSLTPADYLLDLKVGGNPARASGSDGRDLGLEPDVLMSVPLGAELETAVSP
ncbi:MAG: protein kinase [Pirellulales bacterium]